MSLKLIQSTILVEADDNYHLVRLLLLLNAIDGGKNKPVNGLTKLAKLDFLLRYPNCLVRALEAINKDSSEARIEDFEKETIETKMIRFKYGPWDPRYRRWIAMLVSKGLAITYIKGRTVFIQLTESGQLLGKDLRGNETFMPLVIRAEMIARPFKNYSSGKLKNFIYEVFPEIINMKWGEAIKI